MGAAISKTSNSFWHSSVTNILISLFCLKRYWLNSRIPQPYRWKTFKSKKDPMLEADFQLKATKALIIVIYISFSKLYIYVPHLLFPCPCLCWKFLLLPWKRHTCDKKRPLKRRPQEEWELLNSCWLCRMFLDSQCRFTDLGAQIRIMWTTLYLNVAFYASSCVGSPLKTVFFNRWISNLLNSYHNCCCDFCVTKINFPLPCPMGSQRVNAIKGHFCSSCAIPWGYVTTMTWILVV